jgi:AcrR family transcriptional regulator
MALAVKQSEKSRQTDLKVAQSAARAVRTVGVDQMALTRVAADAGFSSGAIYARCDDRSELVVLAWEKSFWPMLSEILTLLTDAVIEKDEAKLARVSELFVLASSPEAVPDIGSAMEVIVASRRDEVIAEVVQRDINGLLDDRGVGPSTDGAARQAVVSAICTLFGASILNSVFPGVSSDMPQIDPTDLLETFTRALRSPVKPGRAHSPLPEATPYVFPTTNDDIRDALISASEYVIARSGVHRATVSRIARRAGVSVGAIYGLYENKESLVSDCLEVLFPPQSRREAGEWSTVFTSTDQRAAVTDILANYMSPSFEQWRRFRLESLIAARHSMPVALQLSAYAAQTRAALLKAAAKAPATASIRPSNSLAARSSVLGLSIFEIVDPSIRQLDWRWIPLSA